MIPQGIPAQRFPQVDTQYSLTPVESIRVVACLDEASEKLAFLNTLTPDVLAHRDELATMVGDEITTLIDEQKKLEEKFEKLVKQQHSMRGHSNQSEVKSINEQVAQVSKQLQEKTTILCRNLRDSPNISENILKIKTERDTLFDLLQRTSRDLTEFSYSTMGKSVAEEKEKSDKLAMAEQNEAKAVQDIEQLQNQIKEMREKYDHIEDMLKTMINKMREELRVLRATRFEEQAKRPATEAKLEALKRVITEEEEEWEQKNMVLQQKIDLERKVHEEFHAYLTQQDQDMKKLMTKWLLKSENEDLSFKLTQVQAKITQTEQDLDNVRSDEMQKRMAMNTREEQKQKDAEAKDLYEKQKVARQAVAILELQHYILTIKFEEERKKKKKKGKGKKKK